MSKSNTFENALLNLIFKNTNIPGIGDAGGLRGSVVAGNLYWALHTADPGEAGSAVTSEAAYTGYVRMPAARGAGFVVTGNQVAPAADVIFPAATGAFGGPVTFASIVDTPSGAGTILYSGAMTPAVTIAAAVEPKILAATTVITED